MPSQKSMMLAIQHVLQYLTNSPAHFLECTAMPSQKSLMLAIQHVLKYLTNNPVDIKKCDKKTAITKFHGGYKKMHPLNFFSWVCFGCFGFFCLLVFGCFFGGWGSEWGGGGGSLSFLWTSITETQAQTETTLKQFCMMITISLACQTRQLLLSANLAAFSSCCCCSESTVHLFVFVLFFFFFKSWGAQEPHFRLMLRHFRILKKS